ncbi:hypothetical protein [Streptomyces rubellomurinus]|nr:hypothetical protein [Streptomyces rubellomurinus]
MTDLDFERRMNPWLFDDKGNLTEEAKKQFPDLAGANDAPVSLTPAGGGGKAVTVNTGVLQQAAQNAFALRDAVKTECGQPAEHVGAAGTALAGWSLGTVLPAAWSTWSNQADALKTAVGDIGTNLQTTAQSYVKTEGDVHASFNKPQGANS